MLSDLAQRCVDFNVTGEQGQNELPVFRDLFFRAQFIFKQGIKPKTTCLSRPLFGCLQGDYIYYVEVFNTSGACMHMPHILQIELGSGIQMPEEKIYIKT